MKGQELLNNVLPVDGLLCIVGLMHDRSAPPIVRYFNMGSEDAGVCIDALEDDGWEVYYGCASYQDSSKAKDVRNIHSIKAFYLDLDCGKESGYATKKDAVKGLAEFCSDTKLPMPTLVDSGFGVHAYWPLVDAIDYNTWKPVADAFKKKTIEKNLKADNVVTADGARILRIPETTNKKRTNQHKPVVLRQTAQAITLEEFMSHISYIPRGAYTESTVDPVMKKLLAKSNKYKFSRIYKKCLDTVDMTEEVPEEYTQVDGTMAFRNVKKKIARSAGCPQIAYCVANRAKLEEPMWKAALSITKFCVDPVEAADMLSRDHPDYNLEEAVSQAQRFDGPRTCEWFKSTGSHPQLCSQCIHNGKIKTPLVLGAMIEQATPEDNIIEVMHETLGEKVTIEIPSDYPYPWMRPKEGGVALRGVADSKGTEPQEDDGSDPDEVLVYEHDLWVKGRMEDGGREVLLMARHLPHDGILEFTAPFSDICKTDKLQAILADRGITAAHNSKRLSLLKMYLSAWQAKLLKENHAVKTRSQFGWNDNDTCFVIGAREIDASGALNYSPIKSSLKNVADIYAKRGTLEEWSKVVNHYAKPGNEARAFALACSFGAPLYKFVGEGSMIAHLTNVSSGVGKSTAQRTAISVWGDPSRGLLTDNDTANAKLNRAGVLQNIIVCIDEITNMLPEAASKFSFDLSSDRGRNRMRSGDNEERENNTTWSTIFLTSGNNSLYDTLKQYKAAVEGELYRILEIPVPLDKSLTKAEADELYANILPRNYGHAGEEFMKYVVPNKQNVIDRLKELQQQFDLDIGAVSKDRYHSACFAAAFTGLEIANHLGLVDIPIEPVWAWAVGLMSDTKRHIKKATISNDDSAAYEEIISRYWNEIIPQILVVQMGASEVDEKLMDKQASLKPVIGSLKGRYEVKSKRLYLAVADFERWMGAKRMPTLQLIAALKERGVLEKEEMFNLGHDTVSYTTGPVLTYRLNADKLTNPDTDSIE